MLAAAAEDRPRRPAVDRFPIAGVDAPRPARVTVGKPELPVDAADREGSTGRLLGP